MNRNYEPNTSRFAVCRVGEGYSVEDRRTGERMGWYSTEGKAIAAWHKMRCCPVCEDASRG